MKCRSAKNKGLKLQNMIRDILIEKYNLNTNDIISTPMGSNGRDIQLYGDNYKLISWCIECKNKESIGISATIEQINNYNKNNDKRIIFIKKNRGNIYVIFNNDDFNLNIIPNSEFSTYRLNIWKLLSSNCNDKFIKLIHIDHSIWYVCNINDFFNLMGV